MKKINLKSIAEVLGEKELRTIMAGSGANCSGATGTIIGYSCSGLNCYIDIQWSNGSIACDCPMPLVVCQNAGLCV